MVNSVLVSPTFGASDVVADCGDDFINGFVGLGFLFLLSSQCLCKGSNFFRLCLDCDFHGFTSRISI
nr:MAG TPA: hypothetical protein [Caudoviricetes sp.]